MQSTTVPIGTKADSKKGSVLCIIDKCDSKAICKCTMCNNYYCYLHIKMDQHDINNFEVLNIEKN